MEITINLPISESDIWTRFQNTEDAFVERKLFSDTDDWLKTVVAFANTCPEGYPGLLFIGVKNDLTVQTTENIESIQNKVTRKLGEAYPTIYFWSRVLTKENLPFVLVIVPGSSARPHFCGPAVVRRGSSNIVASDDLFQELIAQRNSKSYEILKWKGKQITAENRNVERLFHIGPVAGYFEPLVEHCDIHFVRLRTGTEFMTVPLDRVLIAHDDSRNRLKLELYPLPIR